MLFLLKNAGQAFQKLMDGVLCDVPCTFVYREDILISRKSPEEHHEHLRQVFQLLSSKSLVINKAKCIFGTQELDFLGHRVSAEGVQTIPDDPDRIVSNLSVKAKLSLIEVACNAFLE